MTTPNPTTPPPELVAQWSNESPDTVIADLYLATRAAQWGANQELEACCEWVSQWAPRWPDGTSTEDELRAARRPKPPSLKEQALEQLDSIQGLLNSKGLRSDSIRAALEQS